MEGKNGMSIRRFEERARKEKLGGEREIIVKTLF
jgi:hypothetical protein